MAGKRSLPDYCCAACGVTFRPLRKGSRFCSRPCARTINGGHNRKEESWWINGRGYVEGRIWVQGAQVRVKRHRLVMQEAIGRPLLAHEDVHHRDGNKLNNALSNLQLVAHDDHTRITNSSRHYKRGYKLNLSNAERAARSERMRSMRAIAKATGAS